MNKNYIPFKKYSYSTHYEFKKRMPLNGYKDRCNNLTLNRIAERSNKTTVAERLQSRNKNF